MTETEITGALYKSTEIEESRLLSHILDNLCDSFHKQKASGFIGSFNFSVRCNNRNVIFTVNCRDGNVRIMQDESAPDPYLSIACSFETFCNISLGKFNPVIDILKGRIKLDKGIFSLGRFAKFGSLFSFRNIDLKNYPPINHEIKWKIPEKILLINGSPRKNASTHLMLDWFLEGLPKHKTETIDISSLKIAKCLHCFKCWTDHPNICVIDDDAKVFRKKIDEADLIVFFVPLSFFSMPAALKCAFERLFPETSPFFGYNQQLRESFHPAHNNKKPQAFMQFLVWGFPELHCGKLLEENFNTWAFHTQKRNLGCLRRPGINMILSDPRMQFVRLRIKQAVVDSAKLVYEQGVIPKAKKAIVEDENYYSIKDFHFYATNYWKKRFKTDYWSMGKTSVIQSNN